MTHSEYMAEFAIWAITASPLIVATDVRNMTETMRYILLNEEIIAVNQNYETPAGDRIDEATVDCDSVIRDACQVWSRRMNNSAVAVVLLNEGEKDYDVTVDFAMLGENWYADTKLNVRDLWEHKNLGSFVGSFTD